jgi:hypothetical protein
MDATEQTQLWSTFTVAGVSMVRRRSTVRFRKGAPGQRHDSLRLSKLVGTLVVTSGAYSPGAYSPVWQEKCPVPSQVSQALCI